MWSEKIWRCLRDFDFEKVHKAMVALDWKWGSGGVPSVSGLKLKAEHLLHSAIIQHIDHRCDTSSVSGGGLKAEAFRDGRLALVFELEKWVSEE